MKPKEKVAFPFVTFVLKTTKMNLFDVYSLFDLTPVKAEASYLWDDKGEKYLDLYGGHAVISVGHSIHTM